LSGHDRTPAKPIWQRWWFIGIAVIIVVLVVLALLSPDFMEGRRRGVEDATQ
jgi:hypothetical protein